MTAINPYDDLVGSREAADSLGVTRQTFSNWAHGRLPGGVQPFPAPVRVLAATPVWRLTDLRIWYVQNIDADATFTDPEVTQ